MNYQGDGNHQNPQGPDRWMYVYFAVCAVVVGWLLIFAAYWFLRGR